MRASRFTLMMVLAGEQRRAVTNRLGEAFGMESGQGDGRAGWSYCRHHSQHIAEGCKADTTSRHKKAPF